MRIDVLTLFPELFRPHLELGITRRAFAAATPGAAPPIDVRLWPWRDFGEGPHRRVDDRPYGGGPGMVMLAAPLLRAVEAITASRPMHGVPVIHFTPGGEPLGQPRVRELARGPGAVLVCGRYEGIDQRAIDAVVTLELSLGDVVLSGGELPALALLDALARVQPGVLPQASSADESFESGLLEGPHYSRPEVLPGAGAGHGADVPPVLLAGHHAQIRRWRRERALDRTARRRPDLLAAARREGRLDAADEAFLESLQL
jgi:tRNA (guanine37-N1)-methyltransferase